MNTLLQIASNAKEWEEAWSRLDFRPQCPICEHSARVIDWRVIKNYKCNGCGLVFKVS